MELPKIAVGQGLLSDVDGALSREWLVTNGLGGYASSTVLGVNTRKYHGLLVAAFNPPVTRWVLLTKLDETIQIGNERYDLGANEFRDAMHPKGYQYLSEFMVAPLPTFKYDVQGVTVQKTIFMPYLKNATAVIYEVNNPLDKEVTVNVSPLVNSRHIYSMTNKNALQWDFLQKRLGDAVLVETSDSLSSMILAPSQDGSFVDESWWVEKLFFRCDAARKESSVDDQFRLGFFRFSVDPKETNRFHILSTAGRTADETQGLFSSIGKKTEDLELLYHKELNRRIGLVAQFSELNPFLVVKDWVKWLIQAVDSFIVYRASTRRKSVIAGYHWFDDWGRDSLISLPGLTLVTGRFKDAQEILLTFERYCDKGIIPNRFSDKAGDIPLYNTVDATLWFFNGVLQYLKYTGDYRFVQEKMWTTMKQIIEYHLQGTIFGIHMDDDALIAHGPQLTWMDATTPERFVTPRDGKAVEIQALWYNALKTMELLAKRFNQPNKTEKYRDIAEKARANFSNKFWNPRKEYLFDVIGDFGADASLRPNQLIAASLDFPIVDLKMAEKIVDVAWKRLWGKYGLKTLLDSDPRYIGSYLGSWNHRDSAYHNGTVWSWLLGPFTTAFLKTKGYEESWRQFAFKNFLQPLFSKQLSLAGLGTISEIFDGNEPHVPRGCIGQAWSVAEPLRAYIEDITLNRPPHEKEVLNTF